MILYVACYYFFPKGYMACYEWKWTGGICFCSHPHHLPHSVDIRWCGENMELLPTRFIDFPLIFVRKL